MTLTREQMIEALAALLWKTQSVDAGVPQSVTNGRTLAAFANEGKATRSTQIKLATAAFDAMSPKPLVWQRNGDHWAGGFGYVIRRMRAVSGRYYLTRRNAFGQEFDTLEQAKAAAEAHHQQTAWAAMPLADMIGGKG
jgi:hypothetical protein